MTRWLGSNQDLNRGVAFETFALISRENEIHQMPDWVSADFDAPRGRVVWTADNKLYAAALKSTGLEKAKMLCDGQELRFSRIQAPY